MTFDTLEQLYLNDLQDLFDAEKQLAKALPKLAREATSPKLAQGFERHARQTEEQIKRLEKIFQQHNVKAGGRKCPAMAGLIAEANETLQDDLSEQLLDVGLITAAQKVEHYEMSGYTSAISLARTLDFQPDIRLLERTLQEEEQTEQTLSTLSKNLLKEGRNRFREDESYAEEGRTTPRGRGQGTGSRTTARRSGGKSAGRTRQTGSSAQRGGRGGSANATRDHEEIRRWVEERDGSPATVKGTARGRDEAGLLRIDFPGYSGQGTLEHISWEEWFDKFDDNNLQFLYQDRTKDGKTSRFFKLVCEPKMARAR
jgi:ferritin-like metal-binding protein YciE